VKVYTEMVRNRVSDAVPCPRLIPAETKNQPRTDISTDTANGHFDAMVLNVFAAATEGPAGGELQSLVHRRFGAPNHASVTGMTITFSPLESPRILDVD
jgi:hypothetical protein